MIDIAALAKRSGLAASTLRHYEEKGLIASVGRSGLRRTFDAGVHERLAFIALGRSAGFSLEEIRGMFAKEGKVRIDRTMLASRADDIDANIRRLTAVRDGLRHASVCPAPNHLECPTFQRLLRRAAASVPASRTKPRLPTQSRKG